MSVNAADLSAGANQVSFQDTGLTVQTDDTIDVTIADAVDFDFLANTFRALSGSAFNADTINETTSAAGVTVDGVLLKDGGATFSALTVGRVVFAGTGGILTDDADFTFATDTLTVTKIAATSFIGAVDFTNQAVTNVGAAGNDFGASNTLVATTFSGTIDMNTSIITNIGAAGTDFGSSGELTLAAGLTVGADIVSDTADTDNLGSATKEWANLYIGTGKIYFYTDQDESIESDGNQLDFDIGGATRFVMGNADFRPNAANSYDLGTTSREFRNLYLGDAGGLYFGLSQDIYLERGSAGVLYFTTGSLDMQNNAIINVGAAGNDFGASNSLVATSFSDDITFADTKAIQTGTDDNDNLLFKADDTGVGVIEVARLQGAADPYFQATLPVLFTPIATASLPATPVEGMFTYDATLDLITYRDADSWETIAPIKYAEAHIAAGGALTIDTAAEWHAITGATGDIASGISFNAGSTAAITAYADATGGQVTVTSNGHGLSNGDIVTIAGSTNYNGVFEVANVAVNTFEITDTWVADDGAGTWRNGSNFVTDTAGIYRFDWFLSATSAAANNTFAYAIAIDATIQANGKQRRKYATNTDVGTTVGSSLVDASAGNILSLNVQNEGAANNITVNELTMNITRVG